MFSSIETQPVQIDVIVLFGIKDILTSVTALCNVVGYAGEYGPY
jgi:hypothetical protein